MKAVLHPRTVKWGKNTYYLSLGGHTELLHGPNGPSSTKNGGIAGGPSGATGATPKRTKSIDHIPLLANEVSPAVTQMKLAAPLKTSAGIATATNLGTSDRTWRHFAQNGYIRGSLDHQHVALISDAWPGNAVIISIPFYSSFCSLFLFFVCLNFALISDGPVSLRTDTPCLFIQNKRILLPILLFEHRPVHCLSSPSLEVIGEGQGLLVLSCSAHVVSWSSKCAFVFVLVDDSGFLRYLHTVLFLMWVLSFHFLPLPLFASAICYRKCYSLRLKSEFSQY